MGKNSFILYDDYWEHIKLLSREERGDLLTAIYASRGQCEPPKLNSALTMAVSFIISQLERDAKKYAAICERNRRNVNKRWHGDTSVYDPMPNNTSVYDPLPDYTRNTDTDTETGLDIDADDEPD